MKLFTVIMEFKGGTYIKQINAELIDEVIKKWILELDYKEIPGIGKKSYNRLVDEIFEDDDIPLPIDNTKNVWCYGNNINHSLMLLNIINTAIN